MLDAAILLDVLRAPSAASLGALQAALLACEERAPSPEGAAAVTEALALADEFHGYLSALEGRLEARRYAELASRMDIAAVGGVVLENLRDAGERLTERLLVGGLSEGLMALASRQYVEAFRRELAALYRDTAWKLRARFWRLAASRRPGVDPAERAVLIDALLAPVCSERTEDAIRPVLIGLYFQVLLIATVGPVVTCQA